MTKHRSDKLWNLWSTILVLITLIFVDCGNEKDAAGSRIAEMNRSNPKIVVSAPKEKESASIRIEPEPIFEIRSASLGMVAATRPEHCLFGNPKRIEYQKWQGTNPDEGALRSRQCVDEGFVEYDPQGRIVAMGTWSDGATTTYEVVYSASGEVTQTRIRRHADGSVKQVDFSYQFHDNTVTISSYEGDNLLRQETQSFDARNRLLEDIVEDSNGGATYTYAYDDSGSLHKLDRYNVPATAGALSDKVPTNEWLFEHDVEGRVVKCSRLTKVGDRLKGFPVLYSYDSSGNVIRETYGSAENALSVCYQYEFDRVGNWVKQAGSTFPDAGTKSEPVYEIERSISYHE